jgi:hypothetical protein
MGISLAASCKALAAPTMAVGLLGPIPLAHSALAESPARGLAQEIGSPSQISSERPGSPKPSARQPKRKPDASGNLVYEILDNIRTRSGEICSRYGSPDNCLEEAEVCLTMRNAEDDQVRLCLNTVPEAPDRDKAQRTRLRR